MVSFFLVGAVTSAAASNSNEIGIYNHTKSRLLFHLERYFVNRMRLCLDFFVFLSHLFLVVFFFKFLVSFSWFFLLSAYIIILSGCHLQIEHKIIRFSAPSFTLMNTTNERIKNKKKYFQKNPKSFNTRGTQIETKNIFSVFNYKNRILCESEKKVEWRKAREKKNVKIVFETRNRFELINDIQGSWIVTRSDLFEYCSSGHYLFLTSGVCVLYGQIRFYFVFVAIHFVVSLDEHVDFVWYDLNIWAKMASIFFSLSSSS